MKQSVLLTGAAGFIGTVVASKLAQHDVWLAQYDSFEKQVHGEWWKLMPRVGSQNLPHADVVIHLAAKVGVGQSMTDPSDYVSCNTMDTVMMLDRMHHNPPKRLVVASSMSVYGEGAVDVEGNPMPTSESKPVDLRSIYALTKFDQEQLCLIWGKAHGVEVVALRFFNVYGPGQALSNPYTGVLAIFSARLLNGNAPVIYEDGAQSRDFVHVSDVAEAVVHAALKQLPAGIYNVGTGLAHSVLDVALDLANTLGVPIKPNVTGQKRAGDIRHCFADATKLRATGWEPLVGWQVGLRAYCDWLRRQPKPHDGFEDAASELAQAGLVK